MAGAPTHFLVFDAEGDAVSGGFTPDGTLPPGAVVCTQAQQTAPSLWKLVGGDVVAAPAGPALAAYANAKQWELATGGYTATVGGQSCTFATDGQSQVLMIGKVVQLGMPGAPAEVNWQLAAGFVTLSAADFVGMAVACAGFVQSTFDALKTVLAEIVAGTVTSEAEIDAAFAAVPNHA